MRPINTSVSVLVTGATGFIGRRLVEALLARGAAVSVLTRDPARAPAEWRTRGVGVREGDLLKAAMVRGACEDVDTVFHLASHSERPGAGIANGHQELSVKGTEALLDEAERAGVKRFVYASSAKAMGEVTKWCSDETTEARPLSDYGRAKLAAERLVSNMGTRAGVETCSLRLPMVYGPDPKGNLLRMIAAIDRGWFPPLPETGNRRSMVHVDDAVQALMLANTSAAAGNTYLVTDNQIYSTRQIYEAICRALARPIPRYSVPAWCISLAAVAGDLVRTTTGVNVPLTRAALRKLRSSACYSAEKIRRELGYQPLHTLYSALPEMVAAYRAGVMTQTTNLKRTASDPVGR